MNVLTADLISIIVKRDYSIVKHKIIYSWSMVIEYLDQNGKLHRINGPAIIYNDGDWYWYFHGKLHRDKGPAMNMLNCYAWYNMGIFVSKRVIQN